MKLKLKAGKLYKLKGHRVAFWIKGPGNLKKQIFLSNEIILYLGRENFSETFLFDGNVLFPSMGLVTTPELYLEEIVC